VDDRRIPVLEELNMPSVVVGTPRGSGSLPSLWQDDHAAVETVVMHLAGLGHQRIARVGGFGKYWHSALREQAFAEVAAAKGLHAISLEGDYSAEFGGTATRSLIESKAPPTAILYDSDVMALGGLGMAQRLGVSVPSTLSIVSWDDSALCELIHPAVTALHRDIAGVGATAARMLREMANGGAPESVAEPAPEFVVRETTGPAEKAGPVSAGPR
jgi:DNA-binding LacI/PurR family transcriptional regulator